MAVEMACHLVVLTVVPMVVLWAVRSVGCLVFQSAALMVVNLVDKMDFRLVAVMVVHLAACSG